MKYLKLILFFLFSSSCLSSEVEILMPSAGCIDKNSKGNYVNAVSFALKNNSNKEIFVITEIDTISYTEIKESGAYLIGVNKSEDYLGEIKTIPRMERLGLVTLKPNDAANFYYKFEGRKAISGEAMIQYKSTAIYDGRYNNWTGTLTSEIFSLILSPACKS
jgi:hypothetical protein